MNEIYFIDTTFRDGPHSLWAQNITTGMMLPVAETMDRMGFKAIELMGSGAFGAFLIGLLKRRLTVRNTVAALRETAGITCMILTIVIGAMIFGTFVAASGFTAVFKGWITALQVPGWAVVLFVLLIYIPAGMLIDAIPMVLLTVPVITPVLQDLGVNLIWFGVLVVLMAQVAFVSPPVGLVAYVIHGVTKVPLHVVFRGIVPFIIAMSVATIILFLFPQISLFLPNLMTK